MTEVWGIPELLGSTSQSNSAVSNFWLCPSTPFIGLLSKDLTFASLDTMAIPSNKSDIPLQRFPGLYIKVDTPKGRSHFLPSDVNLEGLM